MQLASTEAAAARLAPYALMSALAYHDGPDCPGLGMLDAVVKDRLKVKEAALETKLSETAAGGAKWVRVSDPQLPNVCEDELGLLFHVWHRTVAGRSEVVLVFRGTSGPGDWLYGNLCASCTKRFEAAQARSCAVEAKHGLFGTCPQ